MSVKYRVIERGEPGVPGGGIPKYYAIAVSQGRTTLRDLSKEIARMSTLTRPDVMAVLEALMELLPEKIAQGQVVRLGGFGSFNLTLRSSGSATPEEVNAANIYNNRLNFRPSPEMKTVLEGISYKKLSENNNTGP